MMKNTSAGFRFEPKKHKLSFNTADCHDVKFCRAMCCRKWDIALAEEEFRSGIYKSEAVCGQNERICVHPKNKCLHQSFRLLKKNNACIYLDPDSRCTIYSTRPLVCRNFSCSAGWKLDAVYPIDFDPLPQDARCYFFSGNLKNNMRFLLNPLLKIKTIACKKNKLTILSQDIRYCQTKKLSLNWPDQPIPAKPLRNLLNMFEGKNTLKKIQQKTRQDRNRLYKLVSWLWDQEILVFIKTRKNIYE